MRTPLAFARVDASASPSDSGSEVHDILCSDADDVCVGCGAGAGPGARKSDRFPASEAPRQPAAVVLSQRISRDEPPEAQGDCGLHGVLLHMTKEDTPTRAPEELGGPHMSSENSALLVMPSCCSHSIGSTFTGNIEHVTQSPRNIDGDDAVAERPTCGDSLAVARVAGNVSGAPNGRTDDSSSLMGASAVQRVAMATNSRTSSGGGDSSTENVGRVPKRRTDGSSSLMDASAEQRVAMATNCRTSSGGGDTSTCSSSVDNVAKVAECLHIDSGGLATGTVEDAAKTFRCDTSGGDGFVVAGPVNAAVQVADCATGTTTGVAGKSDLQVTSIEPERGIVDNGDTEDWASMHDRFSMGRAFFPVHSEFESRTRDSKRSENTLGGDLAPYQCARAIRESNSPEEGVDLIEEVLRVAKEQLAKSAAEQRALLERHQLCFEGQIIRIRKAVQLAMMRKEDGIDNITLRSTRVTDDFTRVDDSDARRFPQNSSAKVENKDGLVDLPQSKADSAAVRAQRLSQLLRQSGHEPNPRNPNEKKAELAQAYGKITRRIKYHYTQAMLDSALATVRTRIQLSESLTVQSKILNRFISSWMFQDLVAAILVLYCIYLAFRLDSSTRALLKHFDLRASPDGVNATTTSTGDMGLFATLDIPFLVFFWVEIIIRFLAAQSRFVVGPNRFWNMLDFVIVIAHTLSYMVPFGNLVDRVFLGVFAHVRVFRVVMSFKQLQRYFLIMMHSIRPLFWAIVFLFISIFLFGVLFQLFFNSYIQGSSPGSPVVAHLRPMFHSFPQTLLTLFAAITGGEDWRTIHVVVFELGAFAGVAFLIYILFLILGVLNLITGIFVQGAVDETGRDRELATRAEMEKERGLTASLKELFEELDENGSGVITLDEFQRYFQNEDLRAFFQSFHLDVTKPEVLFDLFDVDENGGIEIDEFVCGCISLKGEAKAVTVETLLRETREFQKRAKRFQKTVMFHLRSLTSVGDNLAPGILDRAPVRVNDSCRAVD
eukprot:TRINITY_DN9045_c0_g2_i1.p1 TRINITY_DN9045_c0_g2~~TRINITY_DN9045_c0_g2_i1.p1  ORF type:complete len:1001 (+),score=166.70 TRINITY_DN9045_c0_g2_i1:72-3074(+)